MIHAERFNPVEGRIRDPSCRLTPPVVFVPGNGLSGVDIIPLNIAHGWRIGDICVQRSRSAGNQKDTDPHSVLAFVSHGKEQENSRAQFKHTRQIVPVDTEEQSLHSHCRNEYCCGSDQNQTVSPGHASYMISGKNNTHSQTQGRKEHPAVVLTVERGQYIAEGRNQKHKDIHDQEQFQGPVHLPGKKKQNHQTREYNH